MAALVRRGLRVAPFKVGPDFIDPGHHTQVSGAQSRNLDGWMLSRDFNRAVFHRNAVHADVAVIEGVMGLFDGYDGRSEAGSTAQMAKWLEAPVLLTVDARSMARSAAALVQGFERFDPDLKFAGVLFNRVGSPRHLSYLTQALEGQVTMPCWGGILRDETLAIPQRHLGLVTRDDHRLDASFVDRLAATVENHLDLDRLLETLPELDAASAPPENPSDGTKVAIAVARDPAFCFYYPENLELLQQYGAETKFFSPIHETALPPISTASIWAADTRNSSPDSWRPMPP